MNNKEYVTYCGGVKIPEFVMPEKETDVNNNDEKKQSSSDDSTVSYTYDDMMKDIEEYKKEKEAYNRGEIDDDMSEECRRDWIKKCNS